MLSIASRTLRTSHRASSNRKAREFKQRPAKREDFRLPPGVRRFAPGDFAGVPGGSDGAPLRRGRMDCAIWR